VSHKDYRIVRLPAESVLHERVQALRAAVARPQRLRLANYVVQAEALYRDLIAPVGAWLAGKSALVIVPDGILHYLPFEVLLPPDRRRAAALDVAQLPYLVREYTISYAPSASVLAGLPAERDRGETPSRALLAVADPIYAAPEAKDLGLLALSLRRALGESSAGRLPRLAESRREVERIAALYAKPETRLLLGEEAREERLKGSKELRHYRILHFAVHTVLNEARPRYSGLVLSAPAAASEEDGLLQVDEIFNLKLQADLVVLSACESGLGKTVHGEGIVGLARAFFYAGTSALVVSLWKVADHSTAELMARFYRYLQDPRRDKAAALRAAQLDLIRAGRFAHPYYWAPFVLLGRPSAIVQN
jgi:CHAT domain-containing protein